MFLSGVLRGYCVVASNLQVWGEMPGGLERGQPQASPPARQSRPLGVWAAALRGSLALVSAATPALEDSDADAMSPPRDARPPLPLS